MINKLIKFLLIIFLLPVVSFNIKATGFSCNCTDDRTVYLSYPYITGHDIEVLQKRLKVLGFYYGPLNGRYDLATYLATISFQKKGDLKDDGIVGRETWDLLGYYNDSIETTQKDSKPSGELFIKVLLDKRQLVLYEDGKVYKVYPVTVGKAAEKTPVGNGILRINMKGLEQVVRLVQDGWDLMFPGEYME